MREDGQPFPSLYFLVQGEGFFFFFDNPEQPVEATIVGSQWFLQLQIGDPVGFSVLSVAFSLLFLQNPYLETLGSQDLMVRPGLAWRWEVPRELTPFSCPLGCEVWLR